MILKEIWKPIKGYEDYEVSDLGNVRSLKNEKVRVLKPKICGSGYYQVNLCKNGKVKLFSVHRLVVTVFIGDIPKGMHVNHINENKLDNRLSNLEIVTAKQNSNHGTRNERIGKAQKGNTNRAKQLDLMLAEYPHHKYTFSSSCAVSEFFGYKYKKQVTHYICQARKRGENFINLRGTRYLFVQQ